MKTTSHFYSCTIEISAYNNLKILRKKSCTKYDQNHNIAKCNIQIRGCNYLTVKFKHYNKEELQIPWCTNQCIIENNNLKSKNNSWLKPQTPVYNPVYNVNDAYYIIFIFEILSLFANP